MVIWIAVSSAEDVNAMLLLAVSSVFLSMRILEVLLKKDHASTLKCLPILWLRNFLGGIPTEQRTGASIAKIFSISFVSF
ncbi:hypothetical protein AB7828_05555 [Tardiphaga sp. 215_C5_N2_1]|uniref:hypothetical protein n=1 Tax=Tardiphaga sp. 215_C5_N2_1 TaxID=3240774 RepID=UPI003F89B414